MTLSVVATIAGGRILRGRYKNLCPATISASIMAANMWKNSLKNVESDNNKILYESLLDFFLQRNGTCFLNKPRTLMNIIIIVKNLQRICDSYLSLI